MAEERIAGKTVLITGSRIGRAAALALAGEGANVILHYNRSGEETESLRRQIEGTGVRAWTIASDFTNRSEYEDLVDRAWEVSGGFEILVNSSSVFPHDTPMDLTLHDFHLDLQVNAWVPFFLCRAFARKAAKGKIINFLDTRIAGLDRSHSGYWLSKTMLENMTRLLAVELAPDFTVNAVAPGLILPPPGKDDSYLENLKHGLPLKRRGDPVDVAAAIIFLLKSTFITGQVIFVDGGRHLMESGHG